jgi:hypothetical protein
MLPTILAWLSLVSSILLLAIFITFRSHYPSLLDRVSLRLIACLSVVNIFHANSMIATSNLVPSVACGLTTIISYMLSLMSLFLIASVAFNLQLVYLHAKRNAARFERWYVVFSVLLAVAITLLSWALGAYDTPKGLLCNTHTRDLHDPAQAVWAFVSFDAWLIGVLLYCGLVLVVIGVVLIRRIRASKEKEQQDIARALQMEKQRRMSAIPGQSGEEPTHVLRRESAVYRDQISVSVARLLLFLLIPWIVYVWTLVVDVDALMNEDGKPSPIWVTVARSATASQGVFILLAFCLDANVRRVYKEMKDDVSEWYIEGTTELVELREHGKDYQVTKTRRVARWLVKHLLLSQADISKAASDDKVFSPDATAAQLGRITRDHSIVVLPTPSWQEQKHRQGMEDAGTSTGNVIALGRPSTERPPTNQFFLGLTPRPAGRDPRKFSVITLGDVQASTSAVDAPGRTMEQQSTISKSATDWSTLTML